MEKKISKNLVGYSYSQGITIASQLLIVPFFVTAWGIHQYGEWLIIIGIPSTLALMELGVSQASATRASIAAGRKDLNSVKQSLDTAFAFSIAASLIIIIVSILTAQIIPWSEWIKIEKIPQADAEKIFICMSISVAGTFMAGPVSAWLKALDKTSTSAFWMANRRAAEVLISLTALILQAEPLALAACIMVSSVITTVLFYFIALYHSEIGCITTRNFKKQELRSVISPAISGMAYPLSITLTSQAGTLILNTLTDSASVAIFITTRTMVRLLMQVGVVFNNSMRPEASRLIGKGDPHQALQLVRKGSLAASITAVVGLASILTIGPYIIEILTGKAGSVTPTYIALIASHSITNVFWYTPATFLFAQNLHSKISYTYLLSSITSIALWIIFPTILSPITAAAFMMLAPELTTLTFTLIAYKKYDTNKA